MARRGRSWGRALDYDEVTTSAMPARLCDLGNTAGCRGSDKYQVLEARRRRAQITARHLLDAFEREDAPSNGSMELTGAR
jgi:hypothetical protein